ncbi:MAG: tRNA (guanosine(37)-N1)-methyltransferase TrmD [Chitinivibrionales bacterium]|nr:tRNA (guanosine(37)-N1)-methyltransferase TrmD [Chitinivibrionales bacterium]MBD3394139.1 tRNA (guanosine(37)-N1)-methyltransferase TrmD [Chitinivibrionales bacterium]
MPWKLPARTAGWCWCRCGTKSCGISTGRPVASRSRHPISTSCLSNQFAGRRRICRAVAVMFFEILTLFPGMFESVFAESIVRRAIDKGVVSVGIDNIRDYTGDRHRTVDDYPYGGGPGMLMKPEPVVKALDAARKRHAGLSPKIIFLSPRGELFNHGIARELSAEQGLVLLCGRYKGLDQRVVEKHVDREISIGDYVLSGGELAAMVVVEAVTRLLPGVLGNEDSAAVDSFFDGLLSPPEYTRPEIFDGVSVPEVLLSGNHARIREWQERQARDITMARRPELWRRYGGEKDI